jgi:succinate dehydrogenase flavin-adding protein (antitoxin of CptAB toxin-antitoxin module)
MEEKQRIRLQKLRWHCRRALLELDIVFQRYWQEVGDDVGEEEQTALERLLEMEDHDLWQLVSGRAEADDPQLQAMLVTLRRLGAADGHHQDN